MQMHLTDKNIGLTKAEVESRIKENKINRAVEDQFKSNWQIIAENTFTYFNLIFAILAFLLIIVQSYHDLTFLPVIIANTVIGIVQEIRAKQVLSKLNVMNEAEVEVIRDGKSQSLPIDQLVLDDLVILKTGDQVPADARVVAGEARVNESLLTGEADEITKQVGDELMSGSFLVSGEVKVQLEKVGKDSYIAKLTLEAKAMDTSEQSEMVRSINRLIKWVGILIIPLGIALFTQNYFLNHLPLQTSITSMEAAIIGMIPEGLYLLTTVALALAAMRLARRQVMLHNMKSVETLARVDTLCVDKTGTITEPVMALDKIVPTAGVEPKYLETLLQTYARNMPMENTTMKAIKERYSIGKGEKADNIIPFTSVNKYSAAVFKDFSLISGAPEMVLRDQFENFSREIEPLTDVGYRVLVFVKYPKPLKTVTDKLEGEVEVLGYICLNNPIRKEAKNTFTYFAKQGVDIKVISGDNPKTVSRVANQAGIKNADRYIDAQTIGENEYINVVKKYTVFGRVKPDQKKKLIQAMKTTGRTVAMTGDGVNDILAMKEADCSIAMASGNSAAVQAAQVVLLDSDFARMPKIVNEGRQVVNNIERSASLFLVKNIFSLLLTFIALIAAVTYPLRPSQITLISAFTIGIPSFLLALETNHRQIRGKFIPNILARAIPGGVTDMLAVGVLMLTSELLHLDHQDVATTATMLLIAVGLLVLYHISKPMNTYRVGVILASLAGLIFSIAFLHKLFVLQMISFKAVFLLIVLFFAEVAIFGWLSKIAEGIREMLIKYSQTGSKTTVAELKEAYRKGIDR